MPSYLSSTQTVGPEAGDDLGRVLGRRREHELERVEQRHRRVAQAVVAGEQRRPADVAGQHPGPLDGVERAVERLRDRRLDEALAKADPQLAGEHLDDGRGGPRGGAREERLERARPWRPPRTPPRWPRTSAATSSSVGSPAGSGAWPASASTSRRPPRGPRTGRRPAASASASAPATRRIAPDRPDQPRPIERWSVSGNGRPVRKTAAIGSSSGVRAAR